MAIQVRRGKESELDISKAVPGEWLVSTDTKYVRMCFAPGIVLRMATYEAFEADMAEIRNILTEARTIQEAVARIQTEINDTAVVVEDYAILSKSYAVGTNNEVREGDATDNAKYYYEQAKHISQGGNGLVPLGTIAFENLPTEDILTNAMYNISNDFTSDERFLDGGGILYGKGSNVFYTVDGKWDVLAASDVKGVKGEAEDTFRQGNVNITKGNIGLENVDNTSDANKPISNEQQAEFDRIDALIGDTDISNIADGTLTGAVNEVNESLNTIGTYDTLLAIGTTVGSHSLTGKISDYRDIVIGLRGDTAGEAWIVPISLPSALFETFNSGFKRIIVTNGNMTCELYYVDDTTIYISAVTASRGVSIYGVK